jgi:hypothetical protein
MVIADLPRSEPTSEVGSLGRSLANTILQRRARLAPMVQAAGQAFAAWVRAGHFTADREPVDLDSGWRYLRQMYEDLPTLPQMQARAERGGYGYDEAVMKPSQAGASIRAMLTSLWLTLGTRCQGTYFLPTKTKSDRFSQTRFIRLVRDNPAMHALMGDPSAPHLRRVTDEGSASQRMIAESVLYFSWIEGKVTTESDPLDFLILDEVQAMDLTKISQAEERLSASMLKVILRLSTANFPDADIDYYYRRSDQREFFTRCKCPEGVVLTDCWDPESGPSCIDVGNGSQKSVPREPFYVCPRCRTILPHPQDGTFRPRNPGTTRVGYHWGQMLSPRQTAATILDKWENRVDTKVFYNRILGMPYTDPNVQPVSDEHLDRVQNPALTWGRGNLDGYDATCMGIDQMGQLQYYVIKGRVPGSSKQRLLWLEVVKGPDTWKRARELMREYKIAVCALEQLLNFDNALEFATDFLGRVFLVTYGDLQDELVLWSDRPREKVSVRKTDDDARVRYGARVDQYRCMGFSLGMWVRGAIETPDARALVKRVWTPKGYQTMAVCRDVLWNHLKHVALVTVPYEGRENERRFRRRVQKIGGEDPHFAYANMLCDVAWIRRYGTEQMLMPTNTALAMAKGQPKPSGFMDQIKRRFPDKFPGPGIAGGIGDDEPATCGTCVNYNRDTGKCIPRLFKVTPDLEACRFYTAAEPEEE